MLDHRELYRLPWTLPDNAIAWLEPTKKCNLACFGCYRENDPAGHKTLDEVGEDLDVFLRYRTVDGISIAGGDPLVHPQIVDIVRMVVDRGVKAVVNTNGLALTPELLQELKGAGVTGFTFHIDSKQNRPGWKDANEIDLNELRLHYARMVADAGDMACAFNSTVYRDTLRHSPGIVAWAQEHIDIVHTVVFIAYRVALVGAEFDHYVQGEKVDFGSLPYTTEGQGRDEIQSTEVIAEIRKQFPDLAPAAYLNGTEKPDSFKWLLTARLGTKERIYGYVGPRTMELTQTFHHATKGRYLAYTRPSWLRRSKALLGLAPVDRRMRGIGRRYLADVLRKPRTAAQKLHFQSIMVIQPVDVLEDGRQNMCDGCPDVTVFGGRLVWSCRLEEPESFGQFVQMVPKNGEVKRGMATTTGG